MARRSTATLIVALVLGLIVDRLAAQQPQQLGAGSFAPGPAIPDRVFSTATQLADGRLLLTGGFNQSEGVARSAIIVDPVTRTARVAGALLVGRAYHTATLLKDGRVLITGGEDGGGPPRELDTAELYDPASGVSTVVGRMMTARARHAAARLNDGRVLVCGGYAKTSAEVFDPATGQFQPVGPMTIARVSHTATTLQTGEVLVVGDGAADLYDPGGNRFVPTGPPATSRRAHTATLLVDGRVLLAGGSSQVPSPQGGLRFASVTTAELYDPANRSFASTGTMGVARDWHTSTLLGDGRVLVSGGYTSTADATSQRVPLSTAELYDPVSGRFSQAAAMQTARSGHVAVAVTGGAWMLGGVGASRSSEVFSTAVRADDPTRAIRPSNSPARTSQTIAVDFQPPVLLMSQRPTYPQAAEAKAVTGTVVVEVTVDARGAVEARVAKAADPLLDAAALAAVRRYRYRPALAAGRPTTASVNVDVRFALDLLPTQVGTVPLVEEARRSVFAGDAAALRHLLQQAPALVKAVVPYLDNPARGTLLHFAAWNGQHNVPGVVDVLLAAGAEPDSHDSVGNTPLWVALARSRREREYFAQDEASDDLAGLFLDHGASVRTKGDGGFTPLLFATAAGSSAKTLSKMLDKGAEVNAKTAGDATALVLAASNGDVNAMRALLGHGANPNLKSSADNGTALHRILGANVPAEAVSAGVGLLLEFHADPKAANSVGTTPLLVAAWSSPPDVVEALIASGASVNVRNAPGAGGMTPLHAAARYGRLDNVEVLLQRGADRTAKNSSGETALDLARKYGQAATIERLSREP